MVTTECRSTCILNWRCQCLLNVFDDVGWDLQKLETLTTYKSPQPVLGRPQPQEGGAPGLNSVLTLKGYPLLLPPPGSEVSPLTVSQGLTVAGALRGFLRAAFNISFSFQHDCSGDRCCLSVTTQGSWRKLAQVPVTFQVLTPCHSITLT